MTTDTDRAALVERLRARLRDAKRLGYSIDIGVHLDDIEDAASLIEQTSPAPAPRVDEAVAWQWKLKDEDDDGWVTRNRGLAETVKNDPSIVWRALGVIHPSPVETAVERDAGRLDALAANSWAVEPFEIPTGSGDADVGWQVIRFDVPNRQMIVAEVHKDDPRAAIDAAIDAQNKDGGK